MSSNAAKCGSLKIYNGGNATKVNLADTTCSIGCDVQAYLMLNIEDVEPVHCEIYVPNNGLATLLNKALNKPVPINGMKVAPKMYLVPNDTFIAMGKEFTYENESEILNHSIYMYQLIGKEKKVNLEFLRKWNCKTVGSISLAPQ